MKKVLFGVMALSMTAFAVNQPNPGDKPNGASVPVRVIAEVVKPASALVITDEAGTILDELLLDHKIVGGSQTADSVVSKNFKVKVTNNDGVVDTTDAGTVKIVLNNTTTTLTKIGTDPNAEVGTKDQIKSTLRLVNGSSGDKIGAITPLEYEAKLSDGEHSGTITSTIASSSIPIGLGAGAYDNKVTGTMPTLTVTYEATPAGK